MERIFDKNLIEKNFSNKVHSYDSNAIIQKIMAEDLFNLIININNHYSIIFEIGAGTGFLTELLIKIEPALLIVNDISKKMLETLKSKISFSNMIYIDSDFLEINNLIKSDLICSNAVFQWIFDLDSLLSKIYTFLNHNGILAFSTFIEGTFKELDKAFNEAYLAKGEKPKKQTLNFLSKEEITNFLIKYNFEIIEISTVEYKFFYNTPNDFLKTIHNIGATLNNCERVKYSIMKKMLEEYKRLFSTEENKVYATYNVLFVIAKKGIM